MLVTHLINKKGYTARVESKAKLLELDQTERVHRELELLKAMGIGMHLPMLPGLLCTFASPIGLFALFKTHIACELSVFMENGGLALEQRTFAAACVVSALGKLHGDVGAIIRNLSPDALTVDSNGIVCLMDFRLSKLMGGEAKTFTLCGAADYLAPEQVTCSGHSFAADIWALGILLWEMTAGEGPWGNDPNEMNVYKRITDHSEETIECPASFEPELRSLVKMLLSKDPASRLAGGFDALQKHAWFKGISWSKLAEGSVASPFSTAAATQIETQLKAGHQRPNDHALTELVGTTEFSGEGGWFADY